MSTALYPYLFRSIFKSALWGGDRIAKKFGREGTPEVCSESWEVSAHPDGMSIVENGPAAGASLEALVDEHGAALVGTWAPDPGKFPLLVKLIDASKRLSVQVHPDDNSAVKCGGEAKTEMWYFLEAPEGSVVCAGLKSGVSPRIFREALKAKQLPTLLRAVPVEEGKAIFIPGGLVHAICEGCLVLEVQQSSNTTYRVYDWDRVGADGKPRELHIKEAENVINWKLPSSELLSAIPMPPQDPANTRERILRSDYFTMERFSLQQPEAFQPKGTSFRILYVLEGSLVLTPDGGEPIVLPLGRSCLVPAQFAAYTLAPAQACVPAKALSITL